MKRILPAICLFFVLISSTAYAQQEEVTLTVQGHGPDKEAAQLSAFRNAIEQTFGAFISSKTEILNDALIKDEIVSISNGNIKSYKVLSEALLSNGGGYITSMKVTVSVTKLTSFIEDKGYAVEYKGALFANNIKLQRLNETAEITAVKNILEALGHFKENSFHHKVSILGEPVSQDGGSDQWKIPISTKTYTTKEYAHMISYLTKNLEGLSLTKQEVKNYESLNKEIYELTIYSDTHSCNRYSYAIYERPVGYYAFNAGNLIKKTKSIDEYLKIVNWPDFISHSSDITCNDFVQLKKLKPKKIYLRNLESLDMIKKFSEEVNSKKGAYHLARVTTQGGKKAVKIEKHNGNAIYLQETSLMPFETVSTRLRGNHNLRINEWQIQHHELRIPENSIVLLNYEENIELQNAIEFDVISLEDLNEFAGYEIR